MLYRDGLRLRAALFRSIRAFFETRDFLEVDTPIRQKVIIPEANITPLMSEDHFLQTSPEIYMKRLLAAGCPRIFQICHCFRKGERGRNHLEEFTMLEWYRLDADYTDLMADCEDLLRFVLADMQPHLSQSRPASASVLLDGTVDTARGWRRISVERAFRDYSPVSLQDALRNTTFDEVLVSHVEPHLGQDVPLFLYDYPVQLASLARKKEADPLVAERFELYIAGLELANGFSELTDALEQRARFTQEIGAIANRDGTVLAMPEQFLQELDSIGNAAGIAFGVDRLLMLLAGGNELADVVPFASSRC